METNKFTQFLYNSMQYQYISLNLKRYEIHYNYDYIWYSLFKIVQSQVLMTLL